jgi:hypothetical protein
MESPVSLGVDLRSVAPPPAVHVALPTLEFRRRVPSSAAAAIRTLLVGSGNA